MKDRVLLFLSLHLPFCLGLLLVFGVWMGGQNRETLRNQQREERIRDEAIRLIEGVRGSCTFEAQTGICNNSFKQEILRAAFAHSDKPVFSAEALTTAYARAWPESFRVPGTRLYGISLAGQGRPVLLSGAGLAFSKGRMILDILERFVRAKDLKSQEKAALDNRTTGIFGENMPFEFLSTQRRGRGTPGSFEGQRVFIVWDFVKYKERPIGAYLIVFPWQTLHSVRPLIRAISPDLKKRKSPLIPFLVPSEAAPARLGICTPPGFAMTPTQKGFFRSLPKGSRREELAPLGRLVKRGDFFLFRDFLSVNLPYEIWVLCSEKALSKPGENALLFFLGVVLACSWFGISTHQLITGRRVFLPLRIWFPAFIALIGAVPLWLFYEAGSMQIDTAEIRQIQQRVKETTQKLGEVDAGNAAITGHFKETARRMLSDFSWYSRILSDKQELFRQAVDDTIRHYDRAGIPLEILLSFPLNGTEKGFTRYGQMSANDSGIRLFTAFMNHCLKVIDYPSPRKADQMSEWMALKAFTGQQGPRGMEMVFGGNNEGSMYDSGGRKLLYFHDLLSIDGVPKSFLVLRALAAEGYFHRLREILKRLNSHEEPFRNYVLGRSVAGGFETDVAPDQQRFWTSTTGRSLEEFMQLSYLNKTRQMYQGHRSFFVVHPCRHADGFFIGAHIPLQDIRLEARTNRGDLNSLTILVLSFILIVGMAASRRLIAPLSHFESALMQVAQGDVSLRVGLDRDDELGLMSRSFDTMIVGLKKRQELGEFVSGTLDRSVGSIGITETLKPEIRKGAVLVSDLRNFTTLSESHSPREVVEMLNRHLEAMAECIIRRDGLIEQIIGDAIVAVFYDSPGRSGAESALQAAIDMFERNVRVQDERHARGTFTYEMGVGIDCGPILTGTIPSSGRLEQAVLGKTRKRAEQLETLSKKGRWTKIILSPDAFRVVTANRPTSLFESVSSGDGYELTHCLKSDRPEVRA